MGGDWSVRKFLCWFTGCLSFVPVGVLAFRKNAGSPNVYFGISGKFCVSFGAEKVDYFLPNLDLKENDVSVLFLPMYLLLGVVLSQIGCSFPIGN